MKQVPLTRGQFALVDDEDFEFLNQWKWQAQKNKTTFYAVRTDYSNGKRNRKLLYMHCEILCTSHKPKIKGDHIDRDGLNNRRSNLRVATYSQNNSNRRPFKNSSSKYLGVGWHKDTSKWAAYIRKDGLMKHLGVFISEEQAAIAYNNAAKLMHGEFANLNII